MRPPAIELRFYSVSASPSGSGRQKFVAIDARGYAPVLIVGFDPQDAGITADMHITGESDLLGQGEHKFDGCARFKTAVGGEVQAAKAHIASLALFFEEIVFLRKSYLERQHHREPPRGTSFNGVVHRPSRPRLGPHLRHATTAAAFVQWD